MHLLAPIAAGMAGAAGGTVEVYARGTSNTITLYTDFEGTVTTSNPASLDANGRAKLYVDQYARCVVKNSSGATVIDFVDGKDANAVELRSASIIGNAYVGGAAAAGNPISVEAAFNKLITSFGSTDFNVLLASASVTLQAALGALWRARVFDVKQYGALGDGATNDLNAINAAASAANTAGGGVVFFPPGTYNISAGLTAFTTVEYVGAGTSVSTIRMTSDVSLIGSAAKPRRIASLSFVYNTSNFGAWLSVSSGTCLVEDCSFQTTNGSVSGQAFSVDSGGSLRVVRSSMGVGGASASFLFLAFPGGHISVLDCTLLSTSTGGLLVSSGNTATPGSAVSRVVVRGCRLDVTAQFGGTCFIARSGGRIVAVGNHIIYQASIYTTVFYSEASDSHIYESGNDVGMVAADLTNASPSGIYYQPGGSIVAGSRDGVVVPTEAPNAATIYVSTDGGSAVIRTTSGAGTRVINTMGSSFSQNGALFRIAVHNDTGSSITYQWGTGFASSGSTFAVAANSVRAFSLIYISERAKWFLVSDAAGAETAE